MTVLSIALAGFAALATLVHIATALLTGIRAVCASRPSRSTPSGERVTLLRPVRGLDEVEHLTLSSTFELGYPDLEVIFCCADANDPVVPFLEMAISQRPNFNARLLVGGMTGAANPKLDNLRKGWEKASGDWIVMADSNLLLPVDYVEQLLRAGGERCGLVSAPPIGARRPASHRSRSVWASP